jgi:hypothetical protein
VINASGSEVNTVAANTLIVKPIRDLNGTRSGFFRLYYNPTTGEIAYDSTVSAP